LPFRSIYDIQMCRKSVAQTLDRFSKHGRDDVMRFASQLIFSIAIGNLDMHAKNVSILHFPDESVILAPTYDQVPLRHQNTDGRMALAIGGEYFHANLSLESIVAELLSWRCSCFSNADETIAFILNRLKICDSALNSTTADDRAYPNLKTDISTVIINLSSGKAIGGTTNRKGDEL